MPTRYIICAILLTVTRFSIQDSYLNVNKNEDYGNEENLNQVWNKNSNIFWHENYFVLDTKVNIVFSNLIVEERYVADASNTTNSRAKSGTGKHHYN